MVRLASVIWISGIAMGAAMCCNAGNGQGAVQCLRQAQELRSQGRFEEARKMLESLLPNFPKTDNERSFTAVLMDNLGLNELDRGNYAAAETYFNHALSAFHPVTAEDPTEIDLKTHLSELYIAEQRPEDAGGILRQVVATLHSGPMTDPLALSRAYDDLAVTYIMQRKYSEPETLLRQSMALVERAVGPDDPDIASSLLTYASLLMAEHRYSEAVESAERAWKIVHSGGPAPDGYVASAALVLSVAYDHVGRFGDAVENGGLSVSLLEKSLGPAHPRLALYLSNYAKILKHANRKKEAREVQKRADAILAEAPTVESGTGGGYTVNVAALR